MKLPKLLFFALFILSLVATGCKKDKDDDGFSQVDKEINEFIFEGLYNYYLWKDEVPKLTDAYWDDYTTQSEFDKAYNSFLTSTSDHEEFFDNLLYQKGVVDRFSWIVDDYTVLEDQLQGVTLSMGYDFLLFRFSSTSNKVFGVVRYVIEDSPADNAGLERGDIFTSINNQELTVDNYYQLLAETTTYTMSLASISGTQITPTGEKVTMTAVEISENPVYYYDIYEVNQIKIGYLFYTGFYPDYDLELNNVFKYFKDNNVDELILDLRYNPGGYLATSVYLASMIYGTNTSEIFLKSVYNDDLQAYLLNEFGSDFFVDYFAENILSDDGSVLAPIYSLNLDRVFIITTSSTASASEAVINGLEPYMNVITIGETTYGKYVGSITIKDEDENGNVNPEHKWAMQPIVVKSANANGVSDFYSGLTPDIGLEEDITNLSVIGNVNEPLLQAAINQITGTVGKKSAGPAFSVIEVADSKDLVPFGKDMRLNRKKLKIKENLFFK